MVVFQSIAHNRFRNILTGTALLLLPGAGAVAQTSVEEPLPNPQSRPSVESYSLPPGPGSTPDGNVLQGPADAEIPLVRPAVVAPQTTPAKTPAESATPAVKPAITDKGNRNAQGKQPVDQAPPRPQVTRDITPPTPKPRIEESTPASDQAPPSTEVPASIIAPDSSPPGSLRQSSPEPPAAKHASEWNLLLFAGLLFILLGALFFWRARRATTGQSTSTAAADRMETIAPDDIAKTAEPLPAVSSPPPAITISFRPHRANTTLFNAVLGFELSLSNHCDEALTEIRVFGSMDQAGEQIIGQSAISDDSIFREISVLGVGKTETVVAEFRIPLTSIRPIVFRSQTLFVPQIQFSIEYTDDAGFRHFQTAGFLVGQEHQPPRQKMAPFRLDKGPRSFAPLGHRLLPAG